MVSTQQGTRSGEGGIEIEGKERVGRGRGREERERVELTSVVIIATVSYAT